MAVDWRWTLRALLTQFEALASRSPGLNHLFVEVADAERNKMMGPSWFAPFTDKKIRIVDGKPQFERWDCCSSGGLPWIHPGFREPKPHETFGEHDSGRIIRDRSGVVRAVAVPMKLRQGFYCGQASEQVAGFKSLADAAATAMAGSNELHEHAFASDLTDIFRKPRGGVRYIFGDVPEAPNHFIAQGWAAGVLQFARRRVGGRFRFRKAHRTQVTGYACFIDWVGVVSREPDCERTVLLGRTISRLR